MASRVQALASKVQAMVLALALALRAVLTIGITLKLELKKLIIIIIIINLIFFFFYRCMVNTIRYDLMYLTCSKKLTGSQLSPPHGAYIY